MARLDHLFGARAGERATIWVQNPVVLGPHWEPQPDLALLKPREDFYTTSLPRPGDIRLVVELAETSIERDAQVKAPAYAGAGVPEVWILDLPGTAWRSSAIPPRRATGASAGWDAEHGSRRSRSPRSRSPWRSSSAEARAPFRSAPRSLRDPRGPVHSPVGCSRNCHSSPNRSATASARARTPNVSVA